MTHDGLGKYLSQIIEKAPGPTADIVGILKEREVDVMVSYLPVGSEEATKWYVEQALQAGVGFINAIPVFIGREPYWQRRFAEAGLPVIGDDIKSQVGATISHRVLTRLFMDRGVRLDRTYQLNFGGNTDFLNMLERERLESKKISKTNAVTSMLDYEMDPDDVHVGPSDHVPWLLDRKWCYIRMEGTTYGDVPLNAELKLEVWDSPNSAGVITDAIRCLKLGLDRGLKGTLVAPSSYFMKSPPHQIHDDIAFNRVEAFIRGDDNETLVGHRGAGQEDGQAAGRHQGQGGHRRPVTAGERRLEAPHRRGAAPAADRRARRRSSAYRATAWLLARLPGRPARGGASASWRRRSYLALAGQAALVERELRARPRAAARRPRASARLALRAYREYGRYLVELMRLPPCRPTRSGALVGNLDDQEVELRADPRRRARRRAHPDRRRTSATTRRSPRGDRPSRPADQRGRRRLARSRSCSSCSARQRAHVGRHAHPVAQPAGDLRRPAPARDARPAGRLGLPQRRHPGPPVRRLDDAAGRAGDAGGQDRVADPAGLDPPPDRTDVFSVALGAPIDVAVERPGRAPAGDPGDGRRAGRRDQGRARAVVQLQADLARRRRRERPTSSAAPGRCRPASPTRARPRAAAATRPTRSPANAPEAPSRVERPTP